MSRRFILMFAALVLTNSARADGSVGHWTTGTLNNHRGVYSATMNDSGALLGEYCFYGSKTCSWMLAVDTACEKDHVYPVLANTDQGAAYFDLVCNGLQENGLYSFYFKNWQDLEHLLKSGARIGIATPMQADQFKVFRFLLDGLSESTKSMEIPFFAAVTSPNPKPGRATTSTLTDTL